MSNWQLFWSRGYDELVTGHDGEGITNGSRYTDEDSVDACESAGREGEDAGSGDDHLVGELHCEGCLGLLKER